MLSLFNIELSGASSPESRSVDPSVDLYKTRTLDMLSPVLIASVDAVFQLLARHKSLTSISLYGCPYNAGPDPFPASFDALQAFVSQAQSPRELTFDSLPLSIDQWRAILFNCNKKVKISFGRAGWRGTSAEVLIDSLNRNQSPTKAHLYHLRAMPEVTLHALVAALELNTSLVELKLHGFDSVDDLAI
jgi:hypothetical protein